MSVMKPILTLSCAWTAPAVSRQAARVENEAMSVVRFIN